MKIGIDASPLTNKQRTGIGRFLHRVLEVWSSLNLNDDIFLFSNKDIYLEFDLPLNWHIIKYKTLSSHAIWYQALYVSLPYCARKLQLDVFWGTNYTIPYNMGNIITYVSIYDLAAFLFPKAGAEATLRKMNHFTKDSVNKSYGVITISESTAVDIKNLFSIDRDKIYVNYIGGFEERKDKNHSAENVNPKLVFDDPFFLFIGTIEPRKNLTTVIKAFELYRKRNQKKVKLILAGKRGWNCNDIYYSAEHSEYSRDIIMPGFISNIDKEYLLSNSNCFLFPSLYEGFGIPILEAFEYRLPVITSNISSCPEVGGEAALYVEDLYNPNELTTCMELIMNMPLEERKKLNQKMETQLLKFCGTKLEEQLYAHITGRSK